MAKRKPRNIMEEADAEMGGQYGETESTLSSQQASGFKNDPGFRAWQQGKGIDPDVQGGDPAHLYNKYHDAVRRMADDGTIHPTMFTGEQ